MVIRGEFAVTEKLQLTKPQKQVFHYKKIEKLPYLLSKIIIILMLLVIFVVVRIVIKTTLISTIIIILVLVIVVIIIMTPVASVSVSVITMFIISPSTPSSSVVWTEIPQSQHKNNDKILL